ncbi:MAG: hypothetical protein O3A82_08905 [Verrucomicrobia bacterium]|jgi:hypothetical protein|nr:hypothetical protein [Verrucomicrobiota bacterium]MDA1047030.1 hypothetical protein [Verrucomicrobiota bacterium]
MIDSLPKAVAFLILLLGIHQPLTFGQLNPTPSGGAGVDVPIVEVKDEEFVEPKITFSVVGWGNTSLKDLFYFPLGNGEDENASWEPLIIAPDKISSPYAFYGREDAPKTLEIYHQAQSYENSEGDIVDVNESKRKLVGTATFPENAEEILLLIMSSGNTIRSYPMPFDEKSNPPGSYAFISQSKKDYGIRFGTTTFNLGSGKKHLAFGKADKNGDMFLQVFDISERNKPRQRASKLFFDIPTARGMVWISDRNGLPAIHKIMDFAEDENALPIGLQPIPREKAKTPTPSTLRPPTSPRISPSAPTGN